MADTAAPDSSTDTARAKIFLSYARCDDEAFVRRLYESLTARGFDVWFDRESMPSRQLTFHQEIIDAIAARDRFVLVVGPGVAQSDYVIQEWRYAYEMDKPVKCVLRLGEETLVPDELKLIDYSDLRDDRRYDAELEKLARQLSDPPPPLGKLIGVPSLPRHLLARTNRVRALKDAVLADLMNPTVITGAAARAGIHGMGGIGKSVLATMLARDREVRRAFPDGVAWVNIGQEPSITTLQREVIGALGGDTAFDTLSEGKQHLKAVLESKAVLLVLDDVWDSAHADAFDALGPRCRVTMTTREASLITALGGTQHEVALLGEHEALTLLAEWAEKPLNALPAIATRVAGECGYLPLALSICGAMVRDGQPWEDVLEALQQADLEYIDHPHGSVMKSIAISMDRLDADQRQRFAELSVFPTDQTIPEAAVQTLWAHTGGMKSRHASRLLTILERKSLLRLDTESTEQREARRMSLHDLLFDYATGMVGDSTALHGQLLDAYRTQCPDGWASGPNDGYFLEHLCDHLAAAGRSEELHETLTDFRFLNEKVVQLGPQPLIDDFDLMLERRDGPCGLVQGAIRLSANIFTEDPRQFGGQLYARLLTSDHEDIVRLRRSICDRKEPWLRAVNQAVTAPGGPLLRTLQGHTDSVGDVAVTPDSTHAISASGDHTIKVWNLDTGACEATLEGHRFGVNAIAVSPDGSRIVSGASDQIVKVWDVATSVCEATLKGHTSSVSRVAFSDDGNRVITTSLMGTVKVWNRTSGVCEATLDGRGFALAVMPCGTRSVSYSGVDGDTLNVTELATGVCEATLRGHVARIHNVKISPDGTRAVSASWDKMLKVWDLTTGECVLSLDGQSGLANIVWMMRDGSRALSKSDGGSLQLWDVNKGACLAKLGGPINALSVTADGTRAVSSTGARDNDVLQVWDLASGSCVATFEGHANLIHGVAITPDCSRVVSGSSDRTLKVWDLTAIASSAAVARHSKPVKAVVVFPDGARAISASEDGRLKVWDLGTGACQATLDGHGSWVNAVAVMPDNTRAISGSSDRTLIVWDLSTGACETTLTGHTNIVHTITLMPDGIHAMSAAGTMSSGGGELKVWNLATNECVLTLEGHASVVAMAGDGTRAVSASGETGDNSLLVRNLGTGECEAVLEGHDQEVRVITMNSEGTIAISGSWDNTLKVWDLTMGDCRVTLEGHEDGVEDIAITPDGVHAISASRDRTIKVWDIASGVCRATFEAHSDRVHALAMMPEGNGFLSASRDSSVMVWDLEDGGAIARYTGESSMEACVAAPDGRTIVAGDVSGFVHVLRLEGAADTRDD